MKNKRGEGKREKRLYLNSNWISNNLSKQSHPFRNEMRQKTKYFCDWFKCCHRHRCSYSSTHHFILSSPWPMKLKTTSFTPISSIRFAIFKVFICHFSMILCTFYADMHTHSHSNWILFASSLHWLSCTVLYCTLLYSTLYSCIECKFFFSKK